MKNNERTKTTMMTKPTILLTLALLLGTLAAEARAAIFTVTNTNNTGAGSLRQAILNANAAADADTIVFASPLFDTAQTINLTSAELAISNPLTITGRGARLLTVRRSTAGGAPYFRVFLITSGTVNISSITISGGDADSVGGGISNSGATLTLNGVAVSGNSAGAGGGLAQDNGTTTILNSTVSGNTAGAGGGILINGGTSNIANTTVSGNTAVGVGAGGIDNSGTLNMNNVTITGNNNTFSLMDNTGGVSTFGATVNTRNTIISGNTAAGSTSPDVVGDFTSNGNNLIGNQTGSDGFTQPTDKTGVAANLGGLTNNGGQTDTHALLANSPAINAGNNCVVNLSCGANNPPVALTTDQRGTGFPRQSGAAVDIGAFEVPMSPTAATVSITGRVVTADGRGIRNVMIRMTDGAGTVRVAYTTTFGSYRFDDAAAGETYILTVKGKRFQFAQPTRILNVGEDTTDVNFIAASQ